MRWTRACAGRVKPDIQVLLVRDAITRSVTDLLALLAEGPGAPPGKYIDGWTFITVVWSPPCILRTVMRRRIRGSMFSALKAFVPYCVALPFAVAFT